MTGEIITGSKMVLESIQECIYFNNVCILKRPTILGTLVSIIAIIIPFMILSKQRKNDIRKEKIKKIEEILIDYNEIFNAVSKFKEKRFGFKEKRFGFKESFMNDYLKDDISDFKKEFEPLKDFFYHKESILNVKFKIYLPKLFEPYQKQIGNVSDIIFSISNIIIFDIHAYEKEKINEYLEGVKSGKKSATTYDKINDKYSIYLDKYMEFDKLIKKEIDKLLK